MKKNIRKFLKFIKVSMLVTVFFMCQQVYIPKAETKVINENLNKTLDLHSMSVRYNEMVLSDLQVPLATFTGDLTGYAADCPLCSGYLGCTNKNVLNPRVTTYDDIDYGNVNIVASSRNIPCGSIVSFDLSGVKVTAIVLDRGVLGSDLDLLVESEDIAIKNVGRKKISYDVLRFGYERDN